MSAARQTQRLVVGMAGTSGLLYGVRLLEVLKTREDIEMDLVMTKSAERAVSRDTGLARDDVRRLATVTYPIADIGASIASGSFVTLGMVVVPCSLATASTIASCLAHDLLTCAADVVLKEGRKLVLIIRETPLHIAHIQSLLAAATAGAVIMPAIPASLNSSASVRDLVDETVATILDRFEIPHDLALTSRDGCVASPAE